MAALQAKADETSKYPVGQNLKDDLDKLITAAKEAKSIGDQERAYILYFRASNMIFAQKKKAADLKYFNLMYGKTLRECCEEIEELQSSLEKRYKEKTSVPSMNGNQQNLKTSPTKQEETSKKPESLMNGFKDDKLEEQGIITPKALYEYLKVINDRKDALGRHVCLIIDIRDSRDFAQSQLKKLPCRDNLFQYVNIPQERLENVSTGTELDKILPMDVRSYVKNRKNAEKVIIFDYNSTDVTTTSNTCLKKIHKLLYDLSRPDERPEKPPLLLKGGFEDWTLTYATCVSDPKYSPVGLVDKNSSQTFRGPEPDIDAYRFADETSESSLSNGFEESVRSELSLDEENQVNQKPWSKSYPGRAVAVKPMLPRQGTPITPTVSKETSKHDVKVPSKAPVPDRSNKPTLPSTKVTPVAPILTKDSLEEEKFKQQKLKEVETEMERLLITDSKNVKPSEPIEIKKPAVPLKPSSNDVFDEEPSATLAKPANVPNGQMPPPAAVSTKIRTGDRTFSESQDPSFKPLSSSGGLSRSYSSPNIVKDIQRIEEEEEDEGRPSGEMTYSSSLTTSSSFMPHFDRRNKPNLTIRPSTLYPVKHRDFYPIYGSSGEGVTGLKNLGNTCFMNSIIQCLANTPVLVEYFVRRQSHWRDINRNSKFGSRGELVEELAELMRVMWSEQYKSVSPKDFKITVSNHMPIFGGCEQQDSHEFLTMLLEKLHLDLNQLKDPIPPAITLPDNMETHIAIRKFWENHTQRNNSVFSRNFEGLLLSTLTCRVCHTKSDSFEVFTCLSLPIPSGSRCTLMDCLKLFTEPEALSGEASWECTTCKVKREATKHIQLCRLPNILVVHLKRLVCILLFPKIN